MPGRSPQNVGRRHTSRQDALRKVRQGLDDALTLPAGDERRWIQNLLLALQRVRRTFRLHVLEAEADDGSLQEIVTVKPQLARRVALLRAEHSSLREEIAVLCARAIDQVDSAKMDVESLRLDAGRLQDHLLKHQAKGADILWDAFVRTEGGEG